MLCDICHKNEATIHIQEIVNGQKKSMHLCSSCAAAKQAGDNLDLGPFNLAGLLYQLAGSEQAGAPEKKDAGESGQLVCPNCSWSEKQLRSTGRVGCENCYRVFESILSEAIKNMHRGTSHLGKNPAGSGNELCKLHSELVKLQKKLCQAVEAEDYESAALYRDRINELKTRCDDLPQKKKEAPGE